MLVDQLPVAGRSFEGGEPGGVQHALAATACELTAAAGGCERGGRADHPANEERTHTSDPIVVVHGAIVFLVGLILWGGGAILKFLQ